MRKLTRGNNDELLSGNEEQQSLNGELETSKEELQPTNEELIIVNRELLERTVQITDARMLADAVVATIREPLLILNKDLIVRNASKSFCRTFHVTEEAAEGKMLCELGNNQWNIPELRTLLQHIIPDKKAFSGFEITQSFPEIGERTMLLNASQIQRESDKEQLILLAIEDITERKRAELKLAALNRDLETKISERTEELHQANESLQEKNLEIALNKYNKRFLTEFSEKYAAYKFHNEFFIALVQYIFDLTHLNYVLVGRLEHTESEDRIQTIALCAFGKPVENIVYPLPDGPCEQVVQGTLYVYPQRCRQIFPKNQTLEKFNVEGYIGYPLFDGSGKAIGLIAVMHEEPIGEARYLSDLLKIFAKRTEIELERIRNEEALEAANKALDISNRQLRQSNDDLLQFAHVASHDLKEPLRKIKTYANRLEDEEQTRLSERGKNYLAKVQSASDRMFSMVEGVLSYSTINSLEQKDAKIDLNELLQNIATDLEVFIDQKKAIIQIDPLPRIEGASPLIYQLFYNLFKNSLKFTNDGIPPIISVASKIISAGDESFTEISIRDNGIGFDEEYAERIFDPFARLNSREKYEGTGLGLALCKKIVLRHGGSITGRGSKNKGSEFIVLLPLQQKNNHY